MRARRVDNKYYNNIRYNLRIYEYIYIDKIRIVVDLIRVG